MLVSFNCRLSCFQFRLCNHSANALELPRPNKWALVGTVVATLLLMYTYVFIEFILRLVQSLPWRRRNYPGGNAAHIFLGMRVLGRNGLGQRFCGSRNPHARASRMFDLLSHARL